MKAQKIGVSWNWKDIPSSIKLYDAQSSRKIYSICTIVWVEKICFY
jgi:hypothetical protein